MPVVESAEHLPELNSQVMILDFETSSGHPRLDSINPWHHCTIAGTGLTTAEDAAAGTGWYVPSGHNLGVSRAGDVVPAEGQFDPTAVSSWLYRQLQRCTTIVGHNVKYDLNCLVNNWQKYHDFKTLILQKEWVDTVVYSKLVDSDRWSYSLGNLSTDWLGEEKGSDEIKPYLKTKNGTYFNKDYGAIPTDICGKYCIQDILLTERLRTYCRGNIDEVSLDVWETEKALTKVLFKIEQRGMRIDLQRLEYMSLQCGILLSKLQEGISKLLVLEKCSTTAIRPAENTDCYSILCSHYGLPVLEWTAGGKGGKNKKPSFSKYALKAYLHHPAVMANSRLMKVVKKILKFRKWMTISQMFLEPYKLLQIDGLLHGSFQQTVRTGRMACSQPNLQQLSKEVKMLIVPWDQDIKFMEQYSKTSKTGTVLGCNSNEVLVSRDLNQAEFRLIVNYCRNRSALDAYANDPTTDYHTLTAEANGIPRPAAKGINFALAFGSGKYRTLNMLKNSLDLLGAYTEKEKERYEDRILVVPEVRWKGKVINKRQELVGFDAFCWTRATTVYDNYHKRFPELKKTSYRASDTVKDKGRIVNLFGRVRKLPIWGSHKAFNALIQSSAADLLKAKAVALDSFLVSNGLEEEIKLISLVHDETITSETREVRSDVNLQQGIKELLEDVSSCKLYTNLDVPVIWDTAVGEHCWADCK